MRTLIFRILLLSLVAAATAGAADFPYDSDQTLTNTEVGTWDTASKITVSTQPGVDTTVIVNGAIVSGTPVNADELTITGGNDNYSATVRFQHTGEMLFNTINLEGDVGDAILSITGAGAEVTAKNQVILDGLDSSGANPVASASLIIDGGKLTISDGDDSAANDPTGLEGLRIGNGKVEIKNSGTLETRTFVFEGGSAIDNSVVVSTGGNFRVTDERFGAGIGNAAFTVAHDAGDVEFAGGLVVGARGVLTVDTLTAATTTNFVLGDKSGITIDTDGSMAVTGTGIIAIDNAAGKSFIDNRAGSFTVAAAAELRTNAFYSSGTSVVDGTVRVASTDADYGVFAVMGGTTTVNGAIASDDIVQTDGTLTINGRMTGQLFESRGGRATIASGGRSDMDTIAVRGTGILDIDGIVKNDSYLEARGGTINIHAGSDIGDGGTIRLGVYSGVMNVNEDVATSAVGDGFVLNGGDLNLLNGIKLTVNAMGATGTFSGKLNFAGGTAEFNDDIVFRGGGVFNNTFNEATLTMNGNAVEFGSGGTLDASSANIVIDDTSGLTISGGTYLAGWNNNAVTMAEVRSDSGGGGLYITGNSKINMTNRLQARAIDAADNGRDLLILASDTLNGAAASMRWEDNGFIFLYETLQDGSGNWGLYAVGYSELSDKEKYDRLMRDWNKHSEVRGHADKLINDAFAQAIFDARRVQLSLDYDNLSQSGKFNADALASLSSSSLGADYDALMLYNGSGLGMVTQAILATNGQTINRLGLRSAFVRREMSLVEDEYDCGPTLASAYMNANLANRLWVTGNYMNDHQKWDEGFAGYEYKGRGVTIGYDRLFGNVMLGAAFSYVGGDFEDLAAIDNDSSIKTYGLHLYGSYNHPSGFFITGAVGGASSDNVIKDARVLNGVQGWNKADYNTRSWLAAMSAGYDWRVGDKLTVTPSVGLSHQVARSESHTQYFSSGLNNASGATLAPGQIKNHSTTIPLKISAGYDVTAEDGSLLALNAEVGYAYELNKNGASGKIRYEGLNMIQPLPIASHAPGRHIFNAGVGMKYMVKQYEFGFNYDYLWKTKFRTHSLVGSIGINF